MAIQFDILLAGAGLISLACVMVLLARRPGRRRRLEMEALIGQSNDSARIALPDHCVFISYRRADSAEIVERLYEHLTADLGQHAVFKDVDSLHPGVDFRTQLEDSLMACQVFLCVMGDQWAAPAGAQSRPIENPGDFVRIEVETALHRNIPLIPLFVRGLHMPAPDFFPAALRDLAYREGLPLRRDPDFRNDVARIIASIIRHVEKQSRQAGTA
jgi:TIR domain